MLEKILEGIERLHIRILKDKFAEKVTEQEIEALVAAKEIIRKHMNDGWIPADERLPEIGEYVLGTNEYGEVLVYHYGWNSTHTRKMFFQLCGAAVNVAAWYPLPKPYSLERNP